MTLGALLQSTEILLLIFGADKFGVFEKAKAGDSTYPIAALLQQQTVPVSAEHGFSEISPAHA